MTDPLAFLPADMNPVEEACWRNKGLAFVLTMLGSRDCANPGGKEPRGDMLINVTEWIWLTVRPKPAPAAEKK